ncbi:hypothetical protein ACFWZ2_38570 [Streptomyces sp. NPDC059002]|uniref:hypothetical protein n=1 Tax=Streptomyces sp. NPDC059002 TaxID=3346690 RepID=UPI003682BFC5
MPSSRTVARTGLLIGTALIAAGAVTALAGGAGPWPPGNERGTGQKEHERREGRLVARVVRDIQPPPQGKLLPGDRVTATFEVRNASDTALPVNGGILLKGWEGLQKAADPHLTVTLTDSANKPIANTPPVTLQPNESRTYAATVTLDEHAGDHLQGRTGLTLRGSWTGVTADSSAFPRGGVAAGGGTADPASPLAPLPLALTAGGAALLTAALIAHRRGRTSCPEVVPEGRPGPETMKKTT